MAEAMSDEEMEFEDALTDQDDEEENKDPRKNLLADLNPTPVIHKYTSHQPDKELMKIYLRVRPFSTQELINGENQGCMEIESDHTLLAHAPHSSHTYKNSMHGTSKHTHKFTFSRIYDETKSQKDFFDDCMLSTVKDFIDGQNCLIFTYGVTNSGKTYTIQGTPTEAGILPRSLDVLFNSIEGRQWENMALKPAMFCAVTKLSPSQEQRQHQIKEAVLKLADDMDVTQACDTNETINTSKATINSTMSEDSLMLQTSSESLVVFNGDCRDAEELPSMLAAAESRVREETAVDVKQQGNIKFSVWVSFGEIYNEYIYDLLEPIAKKKSVRRPTLQLRQDKNGMPYIKGLKQIHTSSADEAYRLLMVGQKNLQVACTHLNHNSSRSHCIFTLKMVRVYDKKDPRMARISMLSFCDLAGAERSSKTQTTGERMKEAGNINTSLLALSRCMTDLRYNQVNKEHPRIVPFRESKLTRLFQSYFSGKGRAAMIVNVNQCASMFDETLHALKYSAIAKQVIITQEPERVAFKRPAPVPHAPPPPTPKRCRHTIEWATPGTMVQAMMEEVAVPANQPLPEEDEFEEEEEGDESSPKVQGLLQIIEELKQQLMESHCKLMSMELQIRQEVCQEMAQQLVEIEQSLTEHHKMDKALAEEKADKRLELLKASFQNRSRKADNIEDNDEYVPSVLLHAEQVKVENLEKTVEELKQQLPAAGTKPSRQLDTDSKQQAVVVDLTAQNIQLKADLAALQEKLQETFDVAAGVAELQQVVEESQLEVESASKKLLKRDDQLRKLQTQVTESEADAAREHKKLLAVEDELRRLQEQFETQLRSGSSSVMECSACVERAQQIVELTAKWESSARQETKMTQMVDLLQCDSDEHRQQMDQLQSVVETATRSNTEKDSQIAQLHRSLAELEAEFKGMKAESCGAETESGVVEEQLNQRLRELTQELKEQEEQTKRLKEELSAEREPGEEQKKELSALEKEVTRLTMVVSEFKSRVAVKDTEITALTESMHQANETIRSKVLNADELSGQLNEEQETKARLQRQLEALQKETDDYIVRVNEQAEQIGVLKERRTKKDTSAVTALKERVNALEKQLSERQEEINAMEDQMVEKDEGLTSAQAKGKMLSERLRVLEKQLDVQKATGDDAKTDTELTTLKQQVCTAETKLNDAEYKHQMSCRQLRREKSQLEKLLRETEAALTETNNQLEEADFRSQESSINAEQSHSKQIIDAEKKVMHVTEAMRDLETCLHSSKAAEVRLCKEVETLKERCRHLQATVYQSEDGERQDGLTDELQRCQQELNEAEKQRTSFAAQVEKLIAELGVSNNHSKTQQKLLAEKHAELRELESEVASLEESHATFELSLSQKNNEMSEIHAELEAVREKCSQLENSLRENESKISEITAEQKTAICEIQTKHQEETFKMEAKISELDATIVQLEQTQSDLKRLADEKDAQICELQAELIPLRANLEKMSKNEAKVDELSSDMAALQKLASEKDVAVQQLESKLHSTERELDEKRTELEKRVLDTERDLGEARKRTEEVEASLQEKEAELLSVRQAQDSVNAQLVEKTDACASLQGELCELKVMAKDLEDEVKQVREEKGSFEEEYRKEVGGLREELAKKGNVEELQESLDALKAKSTDLEAEIARRETSIENYSRQLVASKRETELLNEQLKQSEARESRLRAQIQQSSSCVEEQNERFKSLDKQVLTLRSECDQHETDAKEAAQERTKSNEELELLRTRLSEQKEQLEKLEGRLSREKSSLQEQLDTAREQLDTALEQREKKEQKLRTRNKCITELMEKLDAERNGFQVALKDAKLNEKIIEQLKGVLHEQEATMQTQDVVFRNHEYEVTSLTKELSEQQALVKTLQETEQSLQSRLTQADKVIVDLQSTSHNLERRCKDVTAHDSSVERDVAELRRQLRDVAEVRRQLREVEQEKSQLERILHDTRSNVDKQHKALEVKNKKLEDDIVKLREQVHASDTKKVLELAKWREERDKLVGGLESILKQKDARISDLEAFAKPPKASTRHEQDMVIGLRAKDAIISDLKEQNLQLQHRLTDSPAEETKKEPASRRVTRGRPKKRLSSIALEEATMVPSRRKRTSRIQSTHKSHHKGVENADPHEVVIKEEFVDLDHVTTPKRHHTTRTALNNSTNLGEDRMPEFMSPVVTPPQAEKIVAVTSTCKKRMRRLRSTIPEPYAEQPSMMEVPEKVESPHVIVTRRLRSRRK